MKRIEMFRTTDREITCEDEALLSHASKKWRQLEELEGKIPGKQNSM